MMITFDDGDQSQIEAIGVLEKFCEKHPDFGKSLVLCINDPDYSFGLFGEKLKKFYSEKNWAKFALHTQHHRPLNSLSIDQCINGEIEQEYEKLERYLGEKILDVDTLACPYVIAPTKEILEAIKNYTYHSRHGDVRINYLFGDCGIAENSKDKKFNPWNIKRICIEDESELKKV